MARSRRRGVNANPLLALKALGQHVWLDNLSRALIRDGSLRRLVAEDGVDGVTSNPAIFRQAIDGGADYRADLERLRALGLGAEACYEALVLPDIQAACDLLLPACAASGGETGYVSLEVSPALAHDAAGSEAAARRLRHAVARDNLLIKLPATAAGVQAFERLTAAGIRVNVTLIFSLAQYEAVAQAYLRGAGRWLADGGKAEQLRSVASVFLSRVDTLVDHRLNAIGSDAALALRGGSGVALARICYERYRAIFHGPSFDAFARAGVRPQTPLWASTGSKNPAYGDLLYVEALICPETITTLPDATLTAFRDHGRAATGRADADAEGRGHFAALAALGIDRDDVGEVLQAQGVRLFADAYADVLFICAG